jgi:hypothetical protein
MPKLKIRGAVPPFTMRLRDELLNLTLKQIYHFRKAVTLKTIDLEITILFESNFIYIQGCVLS